MSRTKRFLGGLRFNYAHQALVTLVGLWLTPFLLIRIGSYDYGLWLVATQVTVYLALLDLGVVGLLSRETSYATGRAGSCDEATDLPNIIGRTTRIVLWQIPLVALTAIIFWFSLSATWKELSGPLGLVLLTFVVMFPLRIFHAVLDGLQDLAFLGRAQSISWSAGIIATVVLVFAGSKLYALAIGFTVSQISLTAISWCRLRNRFPLLLPTRLPALSWTGSRAYLIGSFWVTVAKVAQVMLSNTDILIIGTLFGPAAVVPFVCTGKLIFVLGNQSLALVEGAKPALSEIRVGESREHLFQVCTALSQVVLMVSGAVFCVVLISNQAFTSWWVGTAQYGGFELNVMLLLSMLLRHWSTTVSHAIFCCGYERRVALMALLDGLVTVGGSIILINQLGPIGAPLGSILGVCLISLPGSLPTLARDSGVSVVTLIRPLWPWFWRFLVIAISAGAVAKVWVPATALAIAVTALSTGLIYFAVMLPTALRSTIGIYLRPRLEAIRMKLFGAPLVNDIEG